MTYEEAVKMLEAHGGRYERRKLANNTYLEWRGADCIAIKLHNTDIVTLTPKGDAFFYVGEWKTVTTRARINEFAPLGDWRLAQTDGIWHWWRRTEYDTTVEVPFHDNDCIDRKGMLIHRSSESMKELRDLVKMVRSYCRKVSNAVPFYNHHDCADCAGSKTRSVFYTDRDVVLQHIKDGKICPSMVRQAMKESGCTSYVFALVFATHPLHRNSAKQADLAQQYAHYASRAMREYLKARLDLGGVSGWNLKRAKEKETA